MIERGRAVCRTAPQIVDTSDTRSMDFEVFRSVISSRNRFCLLQWQSRTRMKCLTVAVQPQG